MKTPILGSSYVARSVNAADNRMVNLFPEIVPEGGKEPAFLSRTPGLELLVTVGAGPIRGLWNLGNFYYAVSGNAFYKIDATTNIATFIGNVSASTFPASIADNGTQIFIADNGPSYVYNTVTFVFTPMLVGVYPNFPGAVTVDYLDGFFVVNQPNTQKIWASALLDGTTWDATSFASAEGSPDNVVGIVVDHKELWVFGVNTTEVWYNAGTSGFPFAPIQGAFSEVGCAGAYTIAKMDNSIFWVGRDDRGSGIVYKAKGYSGERISTHAVEWQIQQNGSDFFGATGYTYQQDGHSFYVLNTNGVYITSPPFATVETTYVYDASTGSWHERQSYDSGSTSYSRHWGNCHTFVDGVTSVESFAVIGDYANGNLYTFNNNVFNVQRYTDNGSPQQWLRSWRALGPGDNTLRRAAHHSLQLDCETGVGNVAYADPQVMLRWSDDGGHTWSNYRFARLGADGEYGTRVIWRRLGMTTQLRDRVYEVSGTDGVSINIMGAELLASGTNA